MIRRLKDEKAGFINDVSNIIAAECWESPGLVPDLSGDKTLFVFSDYSRVQGRFQTYSFLVVGRSSADYFNYARKVLREEFHLNNRRMSYKGLNDKLKLKALPAFLSCAGAMEGLVITFAVDSRIRFMFADQFLDVWPSLSKIKKNALEDMLRVVHFGAQAVMTAFCEGQSIVWFTDCDQIVASEQHQQLFGTLAEVLIRNRFLADAKVDRVGFGVANSDDGSLEIEDLLAIPDLVAGALCDTLDQLSAKGLWVGTKLSLPKPDGKRKTDMICEWIGNSICPLKKFGVVFQKCGTHQFDFRPTVFRIQNLSAATCESKCSARNGIEHMSDPIRFDIHENERDFFRSGPLGRLFPADVQDGADDGAG